MTSAHLYFAAISPSGKRSLWTTDGTAAGTGQVAVANAGFNGVSPANFATANGQVFFEGFDSAGKANLFVLGAAGSPSELVASAGGPSGLAPHETTAFGGKVYFGGTDAIGRANLFTSDGTAAGTVELPVADGDAYALYPNSLTSFNGKLALEGEYGGGLGDLFVSDGTAAGTVHVPVPGAAASGPSIRDRGMASLGSKLIFEGEDPTFKRALYLSDGTAAGTTELVVPGLSPMADQTGDPTGFTSFGAMAAFTAKDASGQYGIWVTDGTAAGTVELPGVFSQPYGAPMTALPDGRLAFIASNAAGVAGVWVTDGTAAGTKPLQVPGASAAGLQPSAVMTLNDGVVFDGVTAAGPRGLFLWDGTAAAPVLLQSGVSLIAGNSGSDAAALPGTDVYGTSGNDSFAASPGGRLFAGDGGHDTLTINGGFRGSTVSLLANGDQAITHGGQVDTVRGMADAQFLDGREVFDPNDPAAQVLRLYQAALGRAPDQAGLHQWIGSLQAGAPLSDLATAFLGSPEFAARYGAGLGTTGFVTALYQNALGRAPDAAGLADWTSRISSGQITQSQALVGFSESAENRADTAGQVAAGIWDVSEAGAEVARMYDTALGRLPDAGGFSGWVAALNGGASLQSLANGFVTSPEFISTYGALDDGGFVQALYQNTLHRASDAAGAAGWTGALAAGATRAQVVVGFSESAEHKANTAPNIMSSDPSQYGIKLT